MFSFNLQNFLMIDEGSISQIRRARAFTIAQNLQVFLMGFAKMRRFAGIVVKTGFLAEFEPEIAPQR